LTKEGIEKLESRLEYLKVERRSEVAERIKAAIALGDLSENSEYDDAKNEQAFLEGEIVSIQNTLRHAELIDSSESNTEVVAVGMTVTLMDESLGKEVVYTIVGANEADPFSGRISNESPVGAALLGAAKGQTVEVSVPTGIKKLKVLNINN